MSLCNQNNLDFVVDKSIQKPYSYGDNLTRTYYGTVNISNEPASSRLLQSDWSYCISYNKVMEGEWNALLLDIMIFGKDHGGT